MGQGVCRDASDHRPGGKTAQAALPADASLLARFTVNVTEQARQGSLDPVLCRDHEIDLMIDILSVVARTTPSWWGGRCR